jgi:DNA polymerase III sliding clamp (beta) subunit (PCNA family)
MHPIILPMAELRSALTGLGKVINPKATLPVMQCLRIERDIRGQVTLTTADLERFLTYTMEEPAEGEPLVLLAHFEDITRLAKNGSRNDKLALEPCSPKAITARFPLAGQTGEGKIRSLPAAEYPVVPLVKSDAIPVSEAVRSAMLQAMECVSKDATRFVLQGVCLDVSQSNGHYVVATDGKHLFSANSFQLPLPRSLVIPRHKLLVWRDFNKDGDWQLKLSVPGESASTEGLAYVQIGTRHWRFVSRLMEGNYPNWKQVLPDSSAVQTTIHLDPKSLEDVIRTIELLADHDDEYHTLGLEWRDGQARFVYRESAGDSWITCPMGHSRGQGKKAIVFCNRQFLIKALRFGLYRIDIIDELTPIRLSHEGRQMIIMPIRVALDAAAAPTSSLPSKPERRAPDSEPQPTRIPPLTNPPLNPTPMHPPTENPSPQSSAPTLEEALDLVEALRDACSKTLSQIKDLTGKLRLIQRGQRSSEREMQSVRHTLRTLQGVRF